MASVDQGEVGAWEDTPHRNYEADVTAVKLDNREVFVLTRIDGRSSTADLAAISGLDVEEFLVVMARLVAEALVQIEPAEGDRTPVSTRQKGGGSAAITGPALGRRMERKKKERVKARPFRGVDPQDAAFLLQYGVYGHVPGQPYAQPGQPRHGTFEFDRRSLLGRCDLTIADRKEIIFLSEARPDLDHFEFYNLEPTDDRKLIKRAFFKFNRRYHPDAYFRKDVGRYKPMIEAIFTYGVDLHDLLQNNEELRQTYARAVLARNAAYRSDLESERADVQKVKRDRQARVAAQRKIGLRDRLEDRTRSRRRQGGNNPVAQQLAKALRFYENGMQAYEAERFLSAASSLKLAMSYDPKNDTYRQAWEKVSEKAQQVKGETLWKQGYMEESIGRQRDALSKYLQCVAVFPKPEYCARTAELMLELGEDLHRASELAKLAVDADGENLDHLILLARVYDEVNLKTKALAVLERAQKLDPKDARVKRTLRAVKKR